MCEGRGLSRAILITRACYVSLHVLLRRFASLEEMISEYTKLRGFTNTDRAYRSVVEGVDVTYLIELDVRKRTRPFKWHWAAHICRMNNNR
ncbi:unnamed protein product [Parnassius apollo]|uniref:(apollo) hypothetical protein n=1 Tax=Parnassius apollo TaxID=110799 RepID=A0A8S3WXT7_PARAO|nr:unnamed protein product [Parnassius apollo]